MALRSERAPSPRARAPRAALATLRGQAGARRSARESLRDELEAVGDVADLPALLLDRAAEPICLVEVPACPGLAPLLREGDKIRRRRGRFGKAAQPEQRQSPTEGRCSAASPPVVEERQRVRCVEVVVEHAGELIPLRLLRLMLEPDEVVAERLSLRPCLREHRVAEVDRLAPVSRQEEEQDRLAPPLLDRVAKGDDVAERLRHLLAGQLQHPVVHPDARKLAAGAARLGQLVLVVREDQDRKSTRLNSSHTVISYAVF